jgi:hypothetical protein
LESIPRNTASTLPALTEHRALLRNTMIENQRLNAANKHCIHLRDILSYVKPANHT